MLPQSRIDQLNDVSHRFLNQFNPGNANEVNDDKLRALLDPNIQWRDHAFQVRRVGQEAIVGLKKSFTHANQPFIATAKAIIPTPDGCIIEQVWTGKSSNDIVRPDGQLAYKATGREFVCHVCMVVKVSSEGKIEKIDEYYNKNWDEGNAESTYPDIKGASMKD